jgi:hypothetical protein
MTTDPVDDTVIRVVILGAEPVGGRQTLWAVQLVFGPRASLPYRTNPGATVGYVESGTLGFTYVAGEIRITPPGADVTLSRPWPVNAEAMLAPGTTVTYGPATMHLFRNAGEGPAQLAMTMLGPSDKSPFAQAVTTHGKPVEQGMTIDS